MSAQAIHAGPADHAGHVVHVFGAARPLHLGDYLATVVPLRALAAAGTTLTVVIAPPDDNGGKDAGTQLATTLLACGLEQIRFVTQDARRADSVSLAAATFSPATFSPAHAVAVMDLREPGTAMGAVVGCDRGVVKVLDSPLLVGAAIRGARLDLDPVLGYDPQLRPGLANLAVILGALTGRSPIAALSGLRGASALKSAVTEALVETLRPIQSRYRDLASDPAAVEMSMRVS